MRYERMSVSSPYGYQIERHRAVSACIRSSSSFIHGIDLAIVVRSTITIWHLGWCPLVGLSCCCSKFIYLSIDHSHPSSPSSMSSITMMRFLFSIILISLLRIVSSLQSPLPACQTMAKPTNANHGKMPNTSMPIPMQQQCYHATNPNAMPMSHHEINKREGRVITRHSSVHPPTDDLCLHELVGCLFHIRLLIGTQSQQQFTQSKPVSCMVHTSTRIC